MVEGFDISGNSGNVNFATARATGRQFVYIRAGRGIPASGTDGMLDKNWELYSTASRVAGLQRGAYWRFFPSVPFGSQTIAFSNRAKLLELPPMVDIEDAEGRGQAALTDWAINVLTSVEQQTGRVPLLYTNKSFLANNLDRARLGRWPLALARWDPEIEWPDPKAVYWQYTGNSRVDWATGPVDFQRRRT